MSEHRQSPEDEVITLADVIRKHQSTHLVDDGAQTWDALDYLHAMEDDGPQVAVVKDTDGTITVCAIGTDGYGQTPAAVILRRIVEMQPYNAWEGFVGEQSVDEFLHESHEQGTTSIREACERYASDCPVEGAPANLADLLELYIESQAELGQLLICDECADAARYDSLRAQYGDDLGGWCAISELSGTAWCPEHRPTEYAPESHDTEDEATAAQPPHEYVIPLDARYDLHAAGEDAGPASVEQFTAAYCDAVAAIENALGRTIHVTDEPIAPRASTSEAAIWQAAHDLVSRTEDGAWRYDATRLAPVLTELRRALA